MTMLRHLKVHLVQHDILWPGECLLYAVGPHCKILWGSHIFTEHGLIAFKSGAEAITESVTCLEMRKGGPGVLYILDVAFLM